MKLILEKIKFIGGIEKINGGYPISSFNDVISYFKIDCIITCMDVVTLINDDFFKIKSLTWYPNHFQPIRMCDITKLQSFSHIISLCPTDTKLLNNSIIYLLALFLLYSLSCLSNSISSSKSNFKCFW